MIAKFKIQKKLPHYLQLPIEETASNHGIPTSVFFKAKSVSILIALKQMVQQSTHNAYIWRQFRQARKRKNSKKHASSLYLELINQQKPFMVYKRSSIYYLIHFKKEFINENLIVCSNQVCTLWSWARVYIGEESSSLLGFLEWLAAT